MTPIVSFPIEQTVRGGPRVSVIVPCHNHGRYLTDAVNSVLNQTFLDFEILIVDDGSTDPETVALFETYAPPHTTVLRTANQGLARARNLLIAQARGEFLCALDADDMLAPSYLERTVEALDRDPELTFASTRLCMFGSETREWPDSNRCDLPALLAEDTVITPALVRRAAVVDAGGYDEGMPVQGNEDWALWISLVERGGRGTIIPEVLFHYRRRPGTMCEVCSTGEPHLQTFEYLVRKHAVSYERHLIEVLALRSQAAGALGRAYTQSQIETRHLEQSVAALDAETTRLHSRPAAPAAAAYMGTDDLRRAYDRSRAEVVALRASWSWRLTGPLRRIYDLVRRRPS